MRIIRFLSLVFLGLLLSALVALYYVGNDEQFKHKIETLIFKDLGKDLHCVFSGNVESCNLITGSCTLKNASAFDASRNWKWSAQKVVISWSWFRFLIKRIISMHVYGYDVKLFSKITNKKLSVADHFERWSKLPDGPIKTEVKSITLSHFDGAITDESDVLPQANFAFKALGNVRVSVLKNGASVAIAFDNGSMWLARQLAFASLTGSINMTVNNAVAGDFQVSGGCTFANIMKRCIISGTWKSDDFSAHLSSENRLLDVTMGMSPKTLTLSGSIPCADFLKIIHAPYDGHLGTCNFGLQTSMEKPFDSYTGSVTLNNWFYKTRPLPTCSSEFEYHDKVMHGHGAFDFYGTKGEASYVWNDAADKLSTTITLTEPYKIDRLHAQTDIKKSYLDFDFDLLKMVGRGEGKIILTLPEKQSQFIDLTFATERKKIELDFGLDDNTLKLIWLDDNDWYFAAGDFYRSGKHRGAIRQTPDGVFKGECAMASVARMLGFITDTKIFGAGLLRFHGNQSNNAINAHADYDSGEFRIQNLYNGIQSAHFDGTYQIDNRTLLMHTFNANLNKGTVKVEHGVLALSPDYSLYSYYIPLVLDDCFLHWKREASANATGYITLQYAPNASKVSGYLLMDKGQVHSNILSASPEQYLAIGMVKPFVSSSTKTDLAVQIKTSTPIKVAASALTGEVSLDLSFKGTIADPHIQGSVNVNKGTINLPYQPLYITEGTIYFLSHQLDKPMIKLTAKNTIQKYAITMHVTGTVEKPKISFDSSPFLTSQQIMSLLLSGSDDGMLNLGFPFNPSQTIENLLFGAPETAAKAERSLGGFLDSLKNVRVIPRVGGNKGSLTIELMDNLRATIQKDLSRQEEPRIEVEYVGLGDDMVVRGVKDERGDWGAEIEKSWKFS